MTRDNSYSKFNTGPEQQYKRVRNKSIAGSIDRLWPESPECATLKFNIDNVIEVNINQQLVTVVLDSKSRIAFRVSTHEQLSFFSDLKSIVN